MKNINRLVSYTLLISVILITLILNNSCAPAGIPPAQATIWALETQIALKDTYATLTMIVVPSNTSNPPPTSIHPISTPAPPQNNEPQQVTAFLKSKNAKARKGPDLRFPSIGDYTVGTELIIISYYEDWFFVQFPDGKKGWLYTQWVTIPSNIDRDDIPTTDFDNLPPTKQYYP